ncbi:MAG: PAS domain-containing sensor histidine kinase [Rhodospirillaceae bacterium]|nr:PAS domain-containing sensor histidine kinase [Rhodospirillaceae bacterium]
MSESNAGMGGSPHILVRLRLWAKRKGLTGGRLTILLALAVMASGSATYAALMGAPPIGVPNPRTVFILLMLDCIFLLLLIGLVGWRLMRVLIERRKGVAGSKLHVRLVVMFSLVAVTPAILVAVFSVMLIKFGVEQWFNERVITAVDESLAVANAYLDEHTQVIGGDAMAMANDLSRESSGLYRSPARLAQMVATQAAIRGLSEAIVFGPNGQVLASTGLSFSMELSIGNIPRWAYDRADSGEVAILTNPGDERVRALVQLKQGLDDYYLYVGRFVDPKVVQHIDKTNRAVEEYKRLEGTRSGLQITFSAIFGVVALLLLLAAIWVGLSLATQLATPIIRLIDAAERVRSGDLSAHVDEDGASDELASLSRAFNRMTIQLGTQRQELVETNRQLDERRRFSEAVLAGVTAGVIGLDRLGVVELPNRSAAELLGLAPEAMIGRSLAEVAPEMADLFDQVQRRPERSVQEELHIKRDGRNRVLLLRIVAECDEDQNVTGFVATFDDITELLTAQRTAAWADVARRIAHEIKNPLTPIQLSAERLKRKYLKEISSDRETFLSCTDTIVRQVGDIGRMVDEFSAFARMPAPVMKEGNLVEVVDQAVFLAHNGFRDITFKVEKTEPVIMVPCDVRQIGRALTNLLKNAAESIEGREGENLPQGFVSIHIGREDQERVMVKVEDNGRGFPQEQRDRLTEPYVTTRAKGTGLGLAIVKKIMEDHGGDLILEDRDEAGARAILVFHGADDGPRTVTS